MGCSRNLEPLRFSAEDCHFAYENCSSCVSVKGQKSEAFGVAAGLRHGCGRVITPT